MGVTNDGTRLGIMSDTLGQDFLDEPAKYERRVIAFYDVLGWRSKIDAAGTIEEHITNLKNVVRLFGSLKDTYKDKNTFTVKHSTFSDNVVISADPARDSIFTLLVRLGMVQLVSAQMGFFIR